MRILSFPPSLLFTLLFLALSTSVFAQKFPVVQLEGVKMRAPLDLPKGDSQVTLCGLEPGNTYLVVATGMAYGQRATFEIAPTAAFSESPGHFALLKGKKNAARFTANAACMTILVNTSSEEQGTRAPMYLSIKCESCPEANAWLERITGQAEQAVLGVQDGFSAQELVENVLVGGGCFQISDVSYSGEANQIGTFSNGLSNVGFDNGVIMATGNIAVAPGPNDMDGASFGFGFATPDPDLETLTNGTTFDMADIEFDFVPTQSQISFEFVFASEEYCEYVNSQFNDVFGFFISGPGIVGTQNIALIPSTNTPITINNLNHMVNGNLYTHNTPAFGDNCLDGGNGNPPVSPVPPAFGPAVLELQYDGFTKKMVAVANVIPCEKYHIKLKIADVVDGVWDSAVFLRANSFAAGGAVLASPAYPGGFGTAYESCDTGNLLFKRGNGDLSQPLVINFNVAGSATPGVDYVPITSPVVIPAGQSELLVPINIIPDFIPEGTENILLSIPNSCACTQSTVEFLINDRPTLALEAPDQILCIGEEATLDATVSGGLPNAGYQYTWSTGETTASIHTTTTGTYTLTVTDGCSVPAAVSVEISFQACSCSSETFIKTLGEIGANVRGYGVYDSHDGNLYITGLKQDSAVILKMSPDGLLLWMRAFDIKAGLNDNISEILVDAEGMIVGCGHSGDLQPNLSGFVFRYNPISNNMQWVSTYGIESPYVMGLTELANGNYLIYDNPHQPSNDNRMLEITNADGTIEFTSVLTQKLNLGSADNFSSATIFNGKLYGVGRYTNGSNFSDMRHTLSRIDLATGNVDWSRLSHVAPGSSARLYGMDLLIEDNNIISVSYGSEVDDDLNNSQIFLQKTGLGGNLLWVKRFNIPETVGEVVDEVISVPDGFILYAHGSSAPSDLYLIKTDKNGVLQWSKKVDYGFNDFVTTLSTFQSQILVKDNHLFFMTSTEGPGDGQMLVAKTTLEGTVEGNCDFIKPVVVETSEVDNPVNLSVTVQHVPFQEQDVTLVRTVQNTAFDIKNQCKVFITQQFDYTLCPGESVTIDGHAIAQDTTIIIEIPGLGGCDTLRTYTVDALPYPTRSENVALCPGQSVTIDGVVYSQAGTVIDTLPGGADCDTIVTYTITELPYQTNAQTASFCAGYSVTISGVVYTESGTVIDTVSTSTGCDIIITYTLVKLPYQTRAESISLCPGNSVSIGGQVYNQAGTVIDTVPGLTGCDTIITYTLSLLPYQTRSENISLCPGNSVSIGGEVYNQAGTVIDTVPGLTGCDTIITYTLSLLPYQTRSESISFCAGTSVTIGGQVYTQSGTVVDTIPSLNACDTIVTYTLTQLPQLSRSETVSFCPGTEVVVDGQVYLQPAVIQHVHPGLNGACDTVVTHNIVYSTPAPSNVGITCPAAITIGLPSGSGGSVVNYSAPTATSDCLCPGIALNMTSGLPSGSLFPEGVTSVCFAAKDSCGQTATCCFKVTIEEDDPCDTKVVGCMKYELLTITEDAGKNRTYRVRVTNNCSNKLIYTAIQVPDGQVAIEPINFSTYTAPSGNTYKVRSPNFSPQYSVRYSSISDSINNGESDIFKYTLPAQSNVTFIHVVSRLAPYIYLGAHLNTFYCPIGVTPSHDRPGGERDQEEDLSTFDQLSNLNELLLFPNPTSGELFADFSPWQGERLNVQVLDSRGQRIQHQSLEGGAEAQAVELPAELPNGLYFLEVLTENGKKYLGRFVVQR